MPTQSNEVVTQNYIRAFTQRGGPAPSNLVRFAGADEQYLMMGDISRPDRGGVTAINVNDPRRRGLYKRVGATYDAPDIPNATVTFKQKFGGVPWYQLRLDCPISIYESIGLCKDPADPLNGWETLLIASQGIASDKSYKGRTPFDSSDESTADVSFSWMGDVYSVGQLTLGELAAVDVTTEVVDIVYGGFQACSDCGAANDGTRWIYALQQTAGGSSAVNAKVLYSTDGGATWTASALTGLGVGVLTNAIEIVGQYLLVLAKSENAYYVAPINQLTGAPGSWTKVSAGFVASKTPNDVYVESPSRVYFAADGGYIYLATDILSGVTVQSSGNATVQNLLRIRGVGATLYAVGAAGASLKSTNRGQTWAATTGTQGSASVQALAVVSPLIVWTGDSAGVVRVTENGGETWSLVTLPGANISEIQDVVFPTADVGYIAA
ncbi:hypothetical protein SE17_26080, partial [Kouleothrix aurantiaca]